MRQTCIYSCKLKDARRLSLFKRSANCWRTWICALQSKQPPRLSRTMRCRQSPPANQHSTHARPQQFQSQEELSMIGSAEECWRIGTLWQVAALTASDTGAAIFMRHSAAQIQVLGRHLCASGRSMLSGASGASWPRSAPKGGWRPTTTTRVGPPSLCALNVNVVISPA